MVNGTVLRITDTGEKELATGLSVNQTIKECTGGNPITVVGARLVLQSAHVNNGVCENVDLNNDYRSRTDSEVQKMSNILYTRQQV